MQIQALKLSAAADSSDMLRKLPLWEAQGGSRDSREWQGGRQKRKEGRGRLREVQGSAKMVREAQEGLGEAQEEAQ